MSNLLFSCDWGTSSFRLRLVNIETHKILAEVLSEKGVSPTYQAWEQATQNNGITKADFFINELLQNLSKIFNDFKTDIKQIPLILSGMASSSLGLLNLPYAKIPLDIEGKDLIIESLKIKNDILHHIFLISGIKDNGSVIRGEETQLIGIFEWLKLQKHNLTTDKVFVFPGTHSKHIFVNGNKITGFNTYITGELFMLLMTKSILKESVSAPVKIGNIDHHELNAFCNGVKLSQTSGLLKNLFAVRSNWLFDIMDKHKNYFFLSGLLIGSELGELRTTYSSEIIVCCGSNLYELYKIACRELNIPAKIVAPETVDTAVIEAHIKIFKQVLSPSIP